MKKVVIAVVFVGLLLVGCDEVEPKKEIETEESGSIEVEDFGLTEKELEVIEDILGQKVHDGPYTLDDVAGITCLGYDKKLDENGKWVEDTSFIEYEVVLKNGETLKLSIKAWLLEE